MEYDVLRFFFLEGSYVIIGSVLTIPRDCSIAYKPQRSFATLAKVPNGDTASFYTAGGATGLPGIPGVD